MRKKTFDRLSKFCDCYFTMPLLLLLLHCDGSTLICVSSMGVQTVVKCPEVCNRTPLRKIINVSNFQFAHNKYGLV